MGRYELGAKVTIIAPFGDGETVYVITAVMAVNEHGQPALEGDPVAFYQYEIDGSFYAEQFLKEAA